MQVGLELTWDYFVYRASELVGCLHRWEAETVFAVSECRRMLSVLAGHLSSESVSEPDTNLSRALLLCCRMSSLKK